MAVDREQFLSGLIPPSVKDKLNPVMSDFGEVMSWQEDFAHRKFHIIDMLYLLRHAQGYLGLDTVTMDLAERAIRLHDTGRKLQARGILTDRQHHYGSLAIASMVDSDPRVWEAVYHHNDNKLPKDAPILWRVVRDLDRLSAMDYTGLVRFAPVLGFQHPVYMEEDEDKVIEEGILVDIRNPWSTKDYQKRAEVFFNENILPYLSKNFELGSLKLHIQILLHRFKGRDFTNLGRKQTLWEQEVLRMDNGAFEVEPIMEPLRHRFSYKELQTWTVFNRLSPH